MECPNCHIENPEGMKFCGKCGQSLLVEMVCPQCSRANPPDNEFCFECAHLFTEEPLAPTPEITPSLPASPSPEPASFTEDHHRVKRLSGEGGIRFLMLLRKTTTRFTRAGYFVPIVFLVITLIITLPAILDHFTPTYFDQMGHLFRLWFLTDSVLDGDLLPQWLPYWHNGMDTLRYYPPLATYLMLPIDLVTGNPVDTYYIFGAVIIFATCVTSYLLAREFMGRFASVITALLYTFSSLTISSYWFEGNLGRTLVATISPLVFLYAYRTLRTGSRGSFVLLAVSTVLLVLGHGMQAIMTLLVFAPWLLIIGLLPERRWHNLLVTGGGVALGIGLSLFWLLPATTHFDLANVPGVYIDKLLLHSLGFEVFNAGQFHINPFLGIIAFYYFSIALLVAAIIGGVLGFRSRSRWLVIAFTAAMLTGILLSFGTKLGGWYAAFPVLNSFFPIRFLLSVSLPACVLAGMGFQLIFRHILLAKSRLRQTGSVLLAILLVAFIVWDYLPGLSLVAPGSESSLENFSLLLAEESAPGRVIIFTNENAATSYWLTVTGEKPQVFGWANEGTIHHDTIPQMNKAIVTRETDFLNHLFTLWQVNFAFLGGDHIARRQEEFREMGFKQIAETREDNMLPYVLMSRQMPLPPAFSLSQNVLAIGVGAAGLNRHLPWIALGNSDSLEDHDTEYLEHFDAIILWEPVIKDRVSFETMVTALAAAGTDIYISPGRNVGNLAFGVSSEKAPMSGVFRVRNEASPPVSDDEPLELTLPADWYGHIYYRTDGTDIMLDTDGKPVPLLQYKLVGGEKVYFIGAAALCLLDTASVNDAKPVLESMLARSNPNTNPGLTPLVSKVTYGTDAMVVEITAEEDSWVILSESYSPSWRISLGDTPIEYQNVENMLSFHLPAGQHTLNFRYRMTATQVTSVVLSVISLLVLLTVVFRRKKQDG